MSTDNSNKWLIFKHDSWNGGVIKRCGISRSCTPPPMSLWLAPNFCPCGAVETRNTHFPSSRWRVHNHTPGCSVLTGLLIDGRSLTGWVRREYLALCQSLLGISPEPSDIRYSLVRSSWFKENFSQLPEHVDQTTLHRHTRAYILQLCSSVLFLKFDTGKVSLLFLHYLENIDLIGQYSWGSACLASLYRELCRASRLPAVAQMAGPLFLLQLWAWERFPFLAPTLRDRSIPSHAPLGHRYHTLYLQIY